MKNKHTLFSSVSLYIGLALSLAAATQDCAKIETAAPALHPNGEIELLWVPAGKFDLGHDEGRYEAENARPSFPLTPVTISQGFWIARQQVTQATWRRLMGTSVSEQRNLTDRQLPLPGQYAESPMVYVSWQDAMEFCQRFTQAEKTAGRLPAGYVYALPTEAQWDYACRTQAASRSTDERPFVAGLDNNVVEWCRDWYAPYPGKPVVDYSGAATGTERVLRGGGSLVQRETCPSSYRNMLVGFRIALVPAGTTAPSHTIAGE